MKKTKIILFIFITTITFSCLKKEEDHGLGENNINYPFPPNKIVKDMPGNGRSRAVAFSLKGNGYVGLGAYSGNDYSFYCYNMTLKSWNKIAAFGGISRLDATAFVLGDTAYVGLGAQYDLNIKYSDFWKYTSYNDTWTQLNDFPVAAYGAASFVIDSVAYVFSGNDLYQYNSSTDSWLKKAPFPGAPRNYAGAFSIDTCGYLGTGYMQTGNIVYKDFWQYNPKTDSWIQKEDCPTPVYQSASFSLGKMGYIGTGSVSSKSPYWPCFGNIYKYDPSNNTWVENSYNVGGTGGLSASVNFVINDIAYVGTGYDGYKLLKSFSAVK